MNRILRLSAGTARLSKWLSAACLLVLVIIVVVDVALRNLGLQFVAGISEIANYLQISLVYLGLAFAYQDGSFIRMDLLLDRFKGRADLIRSAAVQLFSIVTLCIMLWFSLQTMLNSHAHGILSIGVLRVELYIPQAILCAGLALFILQMTLTLIATILGRRAIDHPHPTEGPSAAGSAS